jgi:aminomethyltransferase
LISQKESSDPVGYVTSPWYSPELQINIALAYVPLTMTEVGTELQVWLPDEYAVGHPGNTVAGQVVDVPFRPSVNPNAREVAKYKGLDYTH